MYKFQILYIPLTLNNIIFCDRSFKVSILVFHACHSVESFLSFEDFIESAKCPVRGRLVVINYENKVTNLHVVFHHFDHFEEYSGIRFANRTRSVERVFKKVANEKVLRSPNDLR